jgi:hypothetical protein
MLLLASIKKYLVIGALVIAALLGTAFVAFEKGVDHQKLVQASAVIKADDKIVKQNDSLQATADKSASQVIVYKDRIITKYKTINHDVDHYVQQDKNANVGLDPEFVRLHDSAASAYNQDAIAGSSSSADGSAGQPPVTTGQAIGVITGNYKRFYQCQQQVKGWVDFYSTLRIQVNGKD